MKKLFLLLAVFLCPASSNAQAIPVNAMTYLPRLVEAQREYWASAPIPDFMAGQVEQESCITLKHSKCWNPNAQLKTSREWGRGLGQVTTAYRADGSVRFDTQAELRSQFKELSGWTTERWADPDYQIRAIVLQDRTLFERAGWAFNDYERVAFTLSGYNGGFGGVLQDRRLCANTEGCNPDKWFGHVEKHSLKSKTPWNGYGKSAFEINREYVDQILNTRRFKYERYF